LAWSDLKGFWMPDWLGFYSSGPYLEDGIHALPESLSGETLGSQPGAPVSSGSVVLGGEDAHQLYTWADVGTALLITK
jgi:lipoprotein-anchoring transpeptidase ErfK/SrfK